MQRLWNNVGALAIGTAVLAGVGRTTAAGAAAQTSAPRVERLMLRVENPAAKLNLQTPALRQVRLGASARLVVYAYITGLKPGTTAHVGLMVSGQGQMYFFAYGPSKLAKITGTHPGWRWFWSTIHPCTTAPTPGVRPECLPQTPGRYRLSAAIDLGPREVKTSTTFLVVRR
jgi:hypothetical protein